MTPEKAKRTRVRKKFVADAEPEVKPDVKPLEVVANQSSAPASDDVPSLPIIPQDLSEEVGVIEETARNPVAAGVSEEGEGPDKPVDIITEVIEPVEPSEPNEPIKSKPSKWRLNSIFGLKVRRHAKAAESSEPIKPKPNKWSFKSMFGRKPGATPQPAASVLVPKANKTVPDTPTNKPQVVASKAPNTLVLRPRSEGGAQYEYVEHPQGPKHLFKKRKKQFYVMVKNLDKGTEKLVAYYPPPPNPNGETSPKSLVPNPAQIVREPQKVVIADLVLYKPPQDLTNLPSRLCRALYNWESWGRSFGYQLSKSEKLTEALKLIVIIIVAIVFIIVLYQGK